MNHNTVIGRKIYQYLTNGIAFREQGDRFYISCPFHAGDNSPSLSVYLKEDKKVPIGSYYCFGCGAHGSWNTLAEKMNLPLINNEDLKLKHVLNYDFTSIRQDLLKKSVQLNPSLYAMEWPTTQEWRGFSGTLINKIGGLIGYSDKDNDVGLLLPVYIETDLQGWVWCRNKKHSFKSSYILSETSWSKKSGLFPYNEAWSIIEQNNYSTVVLVEGIRDALRLIENGIPAMCIFGTHSWSRYKYGLVSSLADKIILCMDGDRAGITATNKIYKDIKNKIDVSVFKLKSSKKIDPENMSQSLLDKLKRRIK